MASCGRSRMKFGGKADGAGVAGGRKECEWRQPWGEQVDARRCRKRIVEARWVGGRRWARARGWSKGTWVRRGSAGRLGCSGFSLVRAAHGVEGSGAARGRKREDDEDEFCASAYSAYTHNTMHSEGLVGGPCISSALSAGLTGGPRAIAFGLLSKLACWKKVRTS